MFFTCLVWIITSPVMHPSQHHLSLGERPYSADCRPEDHPGSDPLYSQDLLSFSMFLYPLRWESCHFVSYSFQQMHHWERVCYLSFCLPFLSSFFFSPFCSSYLVIVEFRLSRGEFSTSGFFVLFGAEFLRVNESFATGTASRDGPGTGLGPSLGGLSRSPRVLAVAITTRLEKIKRQTKDLITTRKRSLRRLCFHKCLSVHRGGGVCLLSQTPTQADTPL